MSIWFIRFAAILTVLFSAVFDAVTPVDQNATAGLLTLAGLLLFVLAELRRIGDALIERTNRRDV